MAGKAQTPPSRPPHCEGQGAGPQEMALVEPRLAGFGPRRGTRQAQGRQPHQKPPSGQRAPPWTYQACSTGSLGSCPWNWKLSPPPGGPFLFPWTTLASPSPTPAQAECQGTTRDLGTGRGAGHGSAPGGAGPGGRDPRPGTRSPGGSRACDLPGGLRVFPWLKRPHPAPRRQICTETLILSEVWAEL